jgi:hypothetical protein
VPFEKLFADGHIPVRDGRFTHSLDLSAWPTGQVEVWLAFQTILGTSVKQPDAVVARFGEMGEHLTGPNVSTSGGMKRVEVQGNLILK